MTLPHFTGMEEWIMVAGIWRNEVIEKIDFKLRTENETIFKLVAFLKY